MNAPTASTRPLLTPEEYLAIEARAETKSEFYRGEMFAMSGGSIAHNIIVANLTAAFVTSLFGRACVAMSSDQRVKVSATGLYTYPDVVVVCGAPEQDPLDRHTLSNPQVLVEVLSPSTEAYDRGAKFRHYQKIDSIRDVLLVSQDAPLVMAFAKAPDGAWSVRCSEGTDATLRVESLGVDLRLTDIYRNIDFTAGPSTEESTR